MVLVDQKSIRIGTADETVVFTYHIHQDLGYFNQYLVAKRFAIQSVNQFKPVDIQGERIFFPCNVSVKLLAIPIEKVPGIQSRQRVFFRNFNKLAVFCHFDCVGYPGPDDFRHVVRLGEKVTGPFLQALHLFLFDPCGNQHRNTGRKRVRFHRLQKSAPVHIRHVQIQQNSRKVPVVFLYELQRFHAIDGIGNLILGSHDVAQDQPVNFLVVHNQDKATDIPHYVSDA